MYQDSVCFDPNTVQKGLPEHVCSTTSLSMEELSYHEDSSAAAAMELELQQQLDMEMENCYANNNTNLMDNIQLMQQVVGHNSNQVLLPNYDQHPNWDISNGNNHDFQGEHLMNHAVEIENTHLPNFANSSIPDLLNLLHLPRVSPSSVLPDSTFSLGFLPGDHFPSTDGGSSSNVIYDSLLQLNLPPQPPYFRDLFQSLPHGYNLPGSRSDSLFGGVEEREGGGSGEVGRNFDTGILEFQRDWDMAKKRNGKGKTKHYPTEGERRKNMNDRFTALKNMVPNPTKPDRASVIADAIGYIKELLRRVNELKILVEKKHCARERIKRHKTEDGSTIISAGAGGEGTILENSSKPEADHNSYNNGSSSLRSSWLQRKSKDTEVDVRIVDDEVTIKLAQRKKNNCLLIVSKVLDELQLDIQHVAGGLVGDNYSFLFNSKICKGSSVYSSAIANKLIDVVNRQYAAIPPTNSF